jgi:hypothetical protein
MAQDIPARTILKPDPRLPTGDPKVIELLYAVIGLLACGRNVIGAPATLH